MQTLKHSCGLAGIYSKRDVNMPERLFYPLFALQHRGQESCGIAYERHGTHVTHKNLGMVGQVLAPYLGERHLAKAGIGHVRYSTQGSNTIENSQPISVECNKGLISLAHNGTISNSPVLRGELFGNGSIFQSATDSELILHLIARSRQGAFPAALEESLLRLEGAFNLVMIHNDGIVAVRDPWGFRPLVMGQKDGMVVLASETCALDIMRIEERREVEPGEIVWVDSGGVSTHIYARQALQSRCIFELIYFARPDCEVFGHPVHSTRELMGAMLAEEEDAEVDAVISVPDSGNSAALGYAQAAAIPFEMGLARNHYAGRTFIQPTPYQREFGVRMKLHPVKEVIRGKRLALIDDSLVRGTTAKIIVGLLRENGAREVHLRLSAPELRYPCYYGIDIPTRDDLISANMPPKDVARHIGADSVRFLRQESLRKCVDEPQSFCYACFSGQYPVEAKGWNKHGR